MLTLRLGIYPLGSRHQIKRLYLPITDHNELLDVVDEEEEEDEEEVDGREGDSIERSVTASPSSMRISRIKSRIDGKSLKMAEYLG